MLKIRTDLAVEAKELYEKSAGKMSEQEGVQADEQVFDFCTVSTVRVLNSAGERAIGKPVGTYINISVPEMGVYGEDFKNCADIIKKEINGIIYLPKEASVLVIGLGNPEITPDAVGPKAVDNIIATRHMLKSMPEQFGSMRPVSAMAVGVMGTTGIESAEIIDALVKKTEPDMVIVIDALASMKLSRVCTTIQISDTGIIPGSGVGNSRAAINRGMLGVPVLAIGVPTVVDALTLTADILESAGIEQPDLPDIGKSKGMMVTPRDIDARLDNLTKLVGMAINLALQPEMSREEIAFLLE